MEVVSAGDLQVDALEDLLRLLEQKISTWCWNVRDRKDAFATSREIADLYNESVRMNLIMFLPRVVGKSRYMLVT